MFLGGADVRGGRVFEQVQIALADVGVRRRIGEQVHCPAQRGWQLGRPLIGHSSTLRRRFRHPAASARSRKSVAVKSNSPSSTFVRPARSGPCSSGRATKRSSARVARRPQVAGMGGDQHQAHPGRRRAGRHSRGTPPGPACSGGTARRRSRSPTAARALGHVGQQRDVPVRQRGDDEPFLQPRQPGDAVRPRVEPVPCAVEVVDVWRRRST